MLAVMPRFENCVWCGSPIEGKGRIDRIYCSDSHRVLACRARKGERWKGRRKPGDTPPPGEFIPRSALPLVAVRMKAQLDAALARIAELEAQLEAQRESRVAEIAAAVALATAAQQNKIDELVAERKQLEAEWEEERDYDLREFLAEQERANALEADLNDVLEALADAYTYRLAVERKNTSLQARSAVIAEENRTYPTEVELKRLRGELDVAQRQSAKHEGELQGVRDLLIRERKEAAGVQIEFRAACDELKRARDNTEQFRKEAELARKLSQQNQLLRAKLRETQTAYEKQSKTNGALLRQLAQAWSQAASERSAKRDERSYARGIKKKLTAANKKLTAADLALQKTREQSKLQKNSQQPSSSTQMRALQDQLSGMQYRAEHAEWQLSIYKSRFKQLQGLASQPHEAAHKDATSTVTTVRQPKNKKQISESSGRQKQRKKSGMDQRVWQVAGSVAVGAAAGAAGYLAASKIARKRRASEIEAAKKEQPADALPLRPPPVRRQLHAGARRAEELFDETATDWAQPIRAERKSRRGPRL